MNYIIVGLLIVSFLMKSKMIFYATLALMVYLYVINKREGFITIDNNLMRILNNSPEGTEAIVLKQLTPGVERVYTLKNFISSRANYNNSPVQFTKAEVDCQCYGSNTSSSTKLDEHNSMLELMRSSYCKNIARRNLKIESITERDLVPSVNPNIYRDIITRARTLKCRNTNRNYYIAALGRTNNEVYYEVSIPDINNTCRMRNANDSVVLTPVDINSIPLGASSRDEPEVLLFYKVSKGITVPMSCQAPTPITSDTDLGGRSEPSFFRTFGSKLGF